MDNWQENHVNANGLQLHYWRTGGDKPPLVLSHGITDNGLCWTRAARELESDYDIIMVDARGHGLSDKPEAGYTADDHADDLAALIEALALEQPRVLGHSMGARTTSTLAHKRPDLVSRIVLEDPPWRDLTPELAVDNQHYMADWRESLAARKRLTTEQLIAEGHELNPGWADVEFGPWSLAEQQVSLNVFGFRQRTMNAWKEIARELTVPTLPVTGDPELGAIVTPEVSKFVAGENSNIVVEQISGAGHNIRREQFDAFMRTVGTFLAG